MPKTVFPIYPPDDEQSAKSIDKAMDKREQRKEPPTAGEVELQRQRALTFFNLSDPENN